MSWYDKFLLSQLKDVRVIYEFKSETEGELRKALHDEAVERLRQIEQILYADEMTSEEKITYMIQHLLPLF